MIYRLLRRVFRIAIGVFFRRIEVEGLENVPADGAVLFVPNHSNSLVDPLLIMGAIDRRVTLTAKNVLAKNPLLGWLMRLVGVVSFHRKEDAGNGADRRQNTRSLEQCRDILAASGAVCIFPEGVSHSDVKLRPFRPGLARLALDYVRKCPSAPRLLIVPVGMLYTAKDRFRSDVWLRFGTPIDAADFLASAAEGPVQALTDEIRSRVEELTLNFETRRESALLSWAAEIVAGGVEVPRQVGEDPQSVAEWFQLLARLQAGYRRLVESDRQEVDALSNRIRRYRRELRRRGVAADEVSLPMHWARSMLFVVRELELLLVGTPLALFGFVNHALPALAVRATARALSRDKDHWASNVVYPDAIIFAAWYAAVLSAAWLLLPPWWAAVYSVALPYTGYYLLLLRDRLLIVFRRTRTFLTFLFHPEVRAHLAREGRNIVEQIRDLDRRLSLELRDPASPRPEPAPADAFQADTLPDGSSSGPRDNNDAITARKSLPN